MSRMIYLQNVYNGIEYLIIDNMISIVSLGLCNNIYDDQFQIDTGNLTLIRYRNSATRNHKPYTAPLRVYK